MADYRQPAARSVHHIIPPDIAPELANDRTNLRLAHLGCNAKHGRGNYPRAPINGGVVIPPYALGPPRQGWAHGDGAHSAHMGDGGPLPMVSKPDRAW